MKTRMTRSWIAGMALLLLTGGFAVAGQSVNKSVDVGSKANVSIENLAGSVRVTGGSGSTVEVSGTIGDDVEELRVEKHGNRVEIVVEIPEGDRDRDLDVESDLEIHVPYDSELDVETVSASIEVSGVRGGLDLESISGSVDIDGQLGALDVSTVSGDIRVAAGSSLAEGDFESVSGSIECAADLGDSGDFSFETVSGDITLSAAGGFSAEWDVQTFSGDIDNDLGPQAERTSKYAPGKELNFTTGGGSASVSVESLSGHVRIRQN